MNSVGLNTQDYLRLNPVYMSVSEVKQLASNGFAIGSHGFSHKLISSLNDEETEMECDPDFYTALGLNHDREFKAFSYPFTDAGIRKGQQAIIQKHFDLTFGCAGYLPKVGNHFQRIPAEQSGTDFENLINSEIIYGNIKSLLWR
jgi:hypothetical protein